MHGYGVVCAWAYGMTLYICVYWCMRVNEYAYIYGVVYMYIHGLCVCMWSGVYVYAFGEFCVCV